MLRAVMALGESMRDKDPEVVIKARAKDLAEALTEWKYLTASAV